MRHLIGPMIFGLLIGIWLGLPGEGAKVDRSAKKLAVSKVGRTTNSRLVDQKRTFPQLLKRWRRTEGVPDEMVASIERSSSQEIRTGMVALAAMIRDDEAFWVNFKLRRTLRAMAGELIRREGSGAFDWGVATGSRPIMSAVGWALGLAEPKNASKYAQLRDLSFLEVNMTLSYGACKGAAMIGAEELLQTERSDSPSDIEFAEDFDFGRYLQSATRLQSSAAAFAAWAARDPEGAAKALAEGIGSQEPLRNTQFASAFKGRAAMVGEQEAAAWISPLLKDDERPEIRKWQVENLVERGMPGSRIHALLDHLPTERDRVVFATKALKVIGFSPGISAITENPSAEFRLRVMNEWADSNKSLIQQKGIDEADRMMEWLKIPEEKRDGVRQGLMNE
jgi:hypothetical protein